METFNFKCIIYDMDFYPGEGQHPEDKEIFFDFNWFYYDFMDSLIDHLEKHHHDISSDDIDIDSDVHFYQREDQKNFIANIFWSNIEKRYFHEMDIWAQFSEIHKIKERNIQNFFFVKENSKTKVTILFDRKIE